MSLRVFGIVMHDGQGPPKLPAGTQLHTLRELAAVFEETEYSAREANEELIKRHFEVVEDLFAQDAVLPAPVGTIFRSTDVVERWMELHYVALSDALAWVEDRVAARVHVRPATRESGQRESTSDLAAVAAEVTRSLRRRAVASVPLRNAEDNQLDWSAAFLVEAELWHEFADAIGDEQDRHSVVRIQLTGPWPPFDFVRLQFGA